MIDEQTTTEQVDTTIVSEVQPTEVYTSKPNKFNKGQKSNFTETTQPVVNEPKVEPLVVAQPEVQQRLLFSTVANPEIRQQLIDSLEVLNNPINYKSPEKIASAQLLVYQKFLFLMIQPDSNSVKTFFLDFLQYINENPRQYIPQRAFIHIDDIPGLSDNQKIEWETLLRLSMELSNPKTRIQTSNSINWEHISEKFITRYREVLLNNIKLSI